MARDLLIAAPMMAPAPGEGAGGGIQSSALAAALMGRGGAPGALPTPQIPLSTLLWMMNQPGAQDALQGAGNLFAGRQWDGMAGSSAMNQLSNQASANVMNGAAPSILGAAPSLAPGGAPGLPALGAV